MTLTASATSDAMMIGGNETINTNTSALYVSSVILGSMIFEPLPDVTDGGQHKIQSLAAGTLSIHKHWSSLLMQTVHLLERQYQPVNKFCPAVEQNKKQKLERHRDHYWRYHNHSHCKQYIGYNQIDDYKREVY